jgi:rSAM/selenodomain-associated transferase 2
MGSGGALAPIAVVIPARQEAGRLPLLLADLASAPQLIAEVVVVDGGSRDGTVAVARLAGARVVHAAPSRGGQLLLGVAHSEAPWLLVLHADARLPAGWRQRLTAVLRQQQLRQHSPPLAWCFDLQVDLPGLHYRLLELAVAWRSWALQRPYGDQGLLIQRRTYQRCGGFRPLPLMEDLEFAERFSRQGRFRSLGLPLRVSGRRWQRLGLLRTVLANGALRRAWRRGVPASALLQRYSA